MSELFERNLAADQKTVAERKWNEGLKPTAWQKPCDIGLFSDDAKQTEMFTAPKGAKCEGK